MGPQGGVAKSVKLKDFFPEETFVFLQLSSFHTIKIQLQRYHSRHKTSTWLIFGSWL